MPCSARVTILTSGEAMRAASDAETRILVAICTAGRPKMLRRCLASLRNQIGLEGVPLGVLIVDNNDRPYAEEIAADLEDLPVPVHVTHEPVRGIPQARNRALEDAEARGVEWLIFIDDDVECADDWLQSYLRCFERFPDADVLQGKCIYTYEEPQAFWNYDMTTKIKQDGQRIKRAATTNVAIRSRVFAKDGLGLRFDPALRFTGGEDSEYFGRARKAGAVLLAVGGPVVHEERVRARQGLRFVARHRFRVGAGAHYLDQRSDSRVARLAFALLRVTGQLIGGVGKLILAPVALIAGPRFFKSFVVSGVRKLAWAAGYTVALLGHRPEPYRRIDGS